MDLPASFGDPPLGFRFGVFFFAGGAIPNPLDILFRKVSGLSTSVSTTEIKEGGQNVASHHLPDKIQHDNLVLERGLIVGSPLVIEFNAAMSSFQSDSAKV